MFCIRSPLRTIPSTPHSHRILPHRAFSSGNHARLAKKQQSVVHVAETISSNPLSEKLQALSKRPKRGGKQMVPGDRTRLNIVSESLCDDVLKRLKPSLKKHKNCDIIDLNPGVGLWSSKLHKAIKPRTHILMEPDVALYSQNLNPLVEAKNSKFKLIPKSGVVWGNLEDLMNGDLLKHQERLQPDDPRLEMPNNTLLFVANLGYYPKKSFHGFRSITTLTIHQLLTAIRTHALFQCYGQVRMLIWMHDKEKSAILPRMISLRKKFSVDAEVSCEMIDEVAGSDAPTSAFRRETALDLESAMAVKDRMAAAGVVTPRSRVGSLEAKAAHHTSDSEEERQLVTTKAWSDELADLERRYELQEFPAGYDKNGIPVYSVLDENDKWTRLALKAKQTTEYKRMKRLRWNLAQSRRKAEIFEGHIAEYQQIMDLLVGLQNDESIEGVAKRKNATERLQMWRETMDHGLPDDHGERILHFIEDRRSLHQDPPLLLWDRRKTEPLMTTSTDFFPEHEMSLLDFHPKSTWPIIRGKNIKNYDFFDFLISSLFHLPTQSLVTGLRAIAPGAAEWILPKCPSIINPAKGGVANINELAVRAMTEDMMEEIMTEWMAWPFRPTKAEMMARMIGMDVDDWDIEGKD